MLSLKKPFVSDIRVNYEKYFYKNNGVPRQSEKDKIVVVFLNRCYVLSFKSDILLGDYGFLVVVSYFCIIEK